MLEIIKKLQSYDLVLTPVKDKKPVAVDKGNLKHDGTKKFEWEKNWKEEDLIREATKTQRVGAWHKESSIYDVDFDDKDFNAHKFLSVFPDTLTIGKNVNGRPVATHLIYKLENGKNVEKYSYPKTVDKGEKIIELLCSGQTVVGGKDRVIIKDIKPTQVDPLTITQYVKLTAVFSELLPIWVKKGIGQRDEAHLNLAGALAHCPLDLDVKRKFVTQFCHLTEDLEVDNRVNKLEYQELQLASGKNVPSWHGLSKLLGHNLKAFDEIKEQTEPKERNVKFPLIDGSTLLTQEYIEPKYILHPIIREKTITQISGGYGSGKTHFGLALALSVAHNRDFMNYKIMQPTPILYVEAELPGSDVKDRINSLNAPFIDLNFDGEKKQSVLNPEFQYSLTQDDLILAGIKYGFPDLAVADDESRASIGRKATEDLVDEIKDKTGQYPILFLDNISALTSIDENKASDWNSFMKWLIKLKSKNISSFIFHHTNKSTGSASGSNMSQRLIDTHIITKRLDEEHRFNIPGKSVQCSVHFDKFRNFGGEHAKTFILTCDEEGNWNRYPMLDQKNMKILKYLKDGYSVPQMCEEDDDLNEKTVYKRIKKLKDQGLVPKDEKEKDKEEIF